MTTIGVTGRNNKGQLGLGGTTDRDEFIPEGSGADWTTIACGEQHTMAIKSDGTLWATGYNYFGQLGLGDSGADTDRNTFEKVGSGTDWVAVACGGSHTMAIKSDGTLWATGYNTFGQLGLGNTTNRDTFEKVGSGTDWSIITCGSYHTMAIKSDGTLWVAGRNNSGQLGLGGNTQRTSFVPVGSDTDWTSIACGGNHSVGLKSGGAIWTTGLNTSGQLGFGDNTQRDDFTQVVIAGTDWASIICGLHSTMAIKTTGTLWATGLNTTGQLGLGDDTNRDEFAPVGVDADWHSVVCGNSHTMAVKSNGTLWATGLNTYGQLGLGDDTNRDELTQVVVEDIVWDTIFCGSHHSISFGFFFNSGNHRSISGIDSGVLFAGKTMIGDRSNGKIYYLDMDTYTDNGLPITRTRRTQIVNKEKVNVIHNRVEVEFEPGVGLDVAEGEDGQDPQAILKWSDDGGSTWSSGRSVDIGEYQQYGTRAIWRRLGKSRNRVYELTIEEPVKIILIGAYANIKACAF